MFIRLGETYFNMSRVMAVFVNEATEKSAGSCVLHFEPWAPGDDPDGLYVDLFAGQVDTLSRWLDRADPEFNPDMKSHKDYRTAIGFTD